MILPGHVTHLLPCLFAVVAAVIVPGCRVGAWMIGDTGYWGGAGGLFVAAAVQENEFQ